MEIEEPWFVYILACRDGTLYTGITNDVERRAMTHNNGYGAKYTRPVKRRPVTLVYSAQFANQSLAAKEECRIKRLSRTNKDFLISNTNSMKKK